MKKITLILLAVLTAGFVFAETKSTLRADIEQIKKGHGIYLPEGNLFVGDSGNHAAAVEPIGDFGVAIVNGQILLSLDINTVGTSNVVDNSLTAADLAPDSVGPSELAPNSVDSIEIVNGGVMIQDIATVNRGARVATKSIVTEAFGEVKYTLITLTNVSFTADDSSPEGESQSIYTFPQGFIALLAARMDGGITNDAHAVGGDYVASIGTVACADDATLTSTEATIIASTAITPGVAGTRKAFQAGGPVAIGTVNNTAGAAGVFMNIGVPDASMTGNPVFTVDRTSVLELWWLSTADLN